MTIAAVSGQVEVVAVSVSNWAAITFDSDVTAGNLIVVLASRWYQSDGVAFVAGDLVATGTATLAAAPSLDASVHGGADAATSSAIWSAIVTETGTLTLTLDVDEVPLDMGGYGVLIAEEYTGSFDASRVEDTTSASGSGTAVSAGSMTSAGAALMVGLCLPWGGSPTFTPGSGWTQIAESEGTPLSGNAERRIVGSGTTDDPDWTMGTSLAWQAVGATYKEVVGGTSITQGDVVSKNIASLNATVLLETAVVATSASLNIEALVGAVTSAPLIDASTVSKNIQSNNAAFSAGLTFPATSQALSLFPRAANAEITIPIVVGAVVEKVLTEFPLDIAFEFTSDASVSKTVTENAATVQALIDVDLTGTLDALDIQSLTASVNTGTGVGIGASSQSLDISTNAAALALSQDSGTDSFGITSYAGDVSIGLSVAGTDPAFTVTSNAAVQRLTELARTDTLLMFSHKVQISLGGVLLTGGLGNGHANINAYKRAKGNR